MSSHTSSQPSASGGLATPTCEGWCATVSLVPGVGVGVLVLVHAEERRAAVIGHEQLRPALARAQGVLREDYTVLCCTVLHCIVLCTHLLVFALIIQVGGGRHEGGGGGDGVTTNVESSGAPSVILCRYCVDTV